jgi:hypothetical protein
MDEQDCECVWCDVRQQQQQQQPQQQQQHGQCGLGTVALTGRGALACRHDRLTHQSCLAWLAALSSAGDCCWSSRGAGRRILPTGQRCQRPARGWSLQTLPVSQEDCRQAIDADSPLLGSHMFPAQLAVSGEWGTGGGQALTDGLRSCGSTCTPSQCLCVGHRRIPGGLVHPLPAQGQQADASASGQQLVVNPWWGHTGHPQACPAGVCMVNCISTACHGGPGHGTPHLTMHASCCSCSGGSAGSGGQPGGAGGSGSGLSCTPVTAAGPEGVLLGGCAHTALRLASCIVSGIAPGDDDHPCKCHRGDLNQQQDSRPGGEPQPL